MGDLSDRIGKFLNDQEEMKREKDDAVAANQAKVKPFLDGTVLPAFQELKAAFEKQGRVVDIYVSDTSARIEIHRRDEDRPDAKVLELRYFVEPRAFGHGFSVTTKSSSTRDYVGETVLGNRSPIELEEITQEMVIDTVFQTWQSYQPRK